MNMKFNLIVAAALMLVTFPLAVSAKPEAKDRGKNKDAGVFGAEFGANEKREGGDKGKAGAKEAVKGKADDKAALESSPAAPNEAAIAKAKKFKKPYYTKFAEAKEVAWKCQQPLMVALLPSGDMYAAYLESKVLKDRLFNKDFVMPNCVLLVWRLKPGKVELPPPDQPRRYGMPPKATNIDARPLKAHETKFLTDFAVPKENGAKFTELRNYPAVICVDAACTKLLFRAPRLDQKKGRVGIGEYISQVVGLFSGAINGEPVVSPALQKVVDNPTEPKKWK